MAFKTATPNPLLENTMRRIHLSVAAGLIAMAAAAGPACGAVLLDQSGEFGPEPDSETRAFEFEIGSAEARVVLEAEVALEKGLAAVRILDPDGETIADQSAKTMTLTGQAVRTSAKTGTFRLEVVPEGAVGKWSARLVELPRLPGSLVFLVPGIGMILVAVAAALFWKRRSSVKWRWLWVGAAVWVVGVAVKIGLHLLSAKAVFGWLEANLSGTAYVVVGGAYVGVQSALCEIGLTLVAVLIWRRLAKDAARGIGIGVGAGAFEALLLGVGTLVGIGAALYGMPNAEPVLSELAKSAHVTPLIWLVPPVERIIAILCHTSSRALVLLAVARRRWLLALSGFLLFAALDGIVGAAWVAEAVGTFNMWLIELAIAPLALISIPIIWWCIRRWPKAEGDEAPAAAASDGPTAPSSEG